MRHVFIFFIVLTAVWVNNGYTQTTKIKICCSSLGTFTPDNTLIEYRAANPYIGYYFKDYQTKIQQNKPNQFTFYIKIDQKFKNYINSLSSMNSWKIHFIIAQDYVSDTLFLLLSGIDNKGRHIYDSTNPPSVKYSSFYVFKSVGSDEISDLVTYDPLHPLNMDLSPNNIGTVPIGDLKGTSNTILASRAANWVANYYNNDVYKINDTCSFIFPSDTFVNYVNSAIKNANASYLEMYFSQNPEAGGGGLSLIITATDINYNQILIKDAAPTPNYYLLEFCNPCPKCASDIDPYGYHLEPPGDTKMSAEFK